MKTRTRDGRSRRAGGSTCRALDPEGLMDTLESEPPRLRRWTMWAVLDAAAATARHARGCYSMGLRRTSGDKSSVVGYMAAAIVISPDYQRRLMILASCARGAVRHAGLPEIDGALAPDVGGARSSRSFRRDLRAVSAA